MGDVAADCVKHAEVVVSALVCGCLVKRWEVFLNVGALFMDRVSASFMVVAVVVVLL